jgi:hypothetical protein
MGVIQEKVNEYLGKYPYTVVFRTGSHARVLEDYLNPDERVLYAFPAQKNESPFDFITSCVVAITTKRIIIGQKRVLWGYLFSSITPDLFNDLKVRTGLFFGTVYIDTVKEIVALSKISKKALDEIETQISTFMMEEKKKYNPKTKDSDC